MILRVRAAVHSLNEKGIEWIEALRDGNFPAD
jgi:hypothetical protein